MNEGDLVFMDGQLVAKARRSVKVEPGQYWTFAIPPYLAGSMWRDDVVPPSAITPYGVASCIFRLGGVQHWQITLHGETDTDAWLRSGWFEPYTDKPSADPAGMVTAIDLVLPLLPEASYTGRDYLASARSYFADRAMLGKK